MSNIATRMDVHFAALAAVGAVAAIGGAQKAEAAIVYSGVVNITINADFNGLYINFMSGATGTDSSVLGWDFNPYIGPAFFFGSGGMQGVSATSGGTISSLNLGDLISAAQLYSSSSSSASFNSTTPGLMGFKFTGDDSATHYGWMRFTMCSSGVPGNIVDYAYEGTADAGINAGAVPAPTAGMAVLALGGVGLIGRRRK